LVEGSWQQTSKKTKRGGGGRKGGGEKKRLFFGLKGEKLVPFPCPLLDGGGKKSFRVARKEKKRGKKGEGERRTDIEGRGVEKVTFNSFLAKCVWEGLLSTRGVEKRVTKNGWKKSKKGIYVNLTKTKGRGPSEGKGGEGRKTSAGRGKAHKLFCPLGGGEKKGKEKAHQEEKKKSKEVNRLFKTRGGWASSQSQARKPFKRKRRKGENSLGPTAKKKGPGLIERGEGQTPANGGKGEKKKKGGPVRLARARSGEWLSTRIKESLGGSGPEEKSSMAGRNNEPALRERSGNGASEDKKGGREG